MTAPRLVPFRPTPPGTEPLLIDDFSTGWDTEGDDIAVGGWTSGGYVNDALVWWGSNPEVEQDPFVRGTRKFKTLTGLPAGTMVLVTIAVGWALGTGRDAGWFVGARINGEEYEPSVGPSGSFSPNVGQIQATVVVPANGELEVELAVEGIHPTFNLNIGFSEITVTTPAAELADIFYDAGVLYVGGHPLSITRGGIQFDPQEEREDYDFPGKASPVQGLDEIVRSRPVLRARFMLTGEYQFTVYRPGGGWANHATIAGARTYTLPELRAAFTSGLYLPDVIAVWPRSRGDYVAVHLPVGIARGFTMGSADKDEGGLDVVIEGRVPSGQPVKTVPYKIHTYAAGTETPG